MLKQVCQRGRSEREGEAYAIRYIALLSETKTTLADCCNVLLVLHQTFGNLDRVQGSPFA